MCRVVARGLMVSILNGHEIKLDSLAALFSQWKTYSLIRTKVCKSMNLGQSRIENMLCPNLERQTSNLVTSNLQL